MLREEINKIMKGFSFDLAKPNKQVFNYVYKKSNSRERALIPANRYKNIYHIQKYETNSIKHVMSKKFISKLPDVDKASNIINEHIKNNSLIYQVIDYDVDGITSGAVSFLIFKKILKYKRYKIIVNKRQWKNGVNDTIIEQLLNIHKNKKIGLVITSDHGSSDGSRLKKLKEAGIDVIVTDHHTVSETNSPENIVDAFVNYKRSNSFFTNDITGATTIYFTLVYYILKYIKYNKSILDELYKLIPYVGLTVISDSVDMGDWVNRKLVKYMLNTLNSNRKLTPFWEIVKSKILNTWFIDQEFISFNLIPNLNSPGRIDDPNISFKLMVADNYFKAEELLSKINEINKKRKSIQNEAMKNLDLELTTNKISIAYKENISGIQGIIASKLLYKNKSSISFCFTGDNNDIASGSGRSINDKISLIEILNKLKNKNYIIRYGGHAAACGLEIKKDYIKDFYKDVNKLINDKIDIVHYTIDDIITDEKQLYKTFMANITELPYGQNYSQPLYISLFKLTSKKIIEKNDNIFLIGSLKLKTDNGWSKDEHKILYTVETEEEKEIILKHKYKELLIIYNIGLNNYKENKLNITAKKIHYLN